MSVNWKDDSSPARLKAHAAAMASGEFDHTVPTWDIYCDLREALIYALLVVGFPARSDWAITEKNWEEVYKRLHILERYSTFGCYRVYNNGDHAPRQVYFTPEEVRSMIGLSVNAGNKSDTEFRNEIWGKMMVTTTPLLVEANEPPDDGYERERRQMDHDLESRSCNNLNQHEIDLIESSPRTALQSDF